MGKASKLIDKEIDGGKILLVSVGSKQYREATGDLMEFSRKFKKTCYVTLNDPYENIKAKAGSAMVFIDCVTSTIKSPKSEEGVIFVSSPRALTEISIAIKKAIESFKMDFIIFDSLSALLVYEKSLSAMKFVHSMILTLRNAKTSAVLVILKEDVSEEVMKDLSMFVDKVVEVG
jgi:hypothetical protein